MLYNIVGAIGMLLFVGCLVGFGYAWGTIGFTSWWTPVLIIGAFIGFLIEVVARMKYMETNRGWIPPARYRRPLKQPTK